MTVTLPADWRTNPKVAEKTLQLLRQARNLRNPPREWSTPGELAQAITRGTVQTPMLDLVDRELVRAATTPDSRLILSTPPQEGKSQRVTRTFPLWLLTRDPEMRIGIASYAQNLADDFGNDIRNFITANSGVDGTLDLRLRLSQHSRAKGKWVLDGHRGGVYAVGIGGGFTGRPADAVIIDDPFADAEQAGSPAYRDKVWEWWTKVVAPRLAPGAPVILVMTRWHEDDLVGRLLAAEDGSRWRVVNVPAQANHDPAKGQTDPLGREPGQWLQSARGRTVAEWEAIKIQVGSAAFTALYQGAPSPDAGNVWQRPWWARYQRPLWLPHADKPDVMLVTGFDEVIQSWDMAFKDTKGSDYVVGQVWGRIGPDAFLLDQTRDRLSFTATLDAVRALTRKWPAARVKLIEDKANGTAVLDSLRGDKEIGGGFIAIDPKGSKYARASAVAPFVEAGNVHLPADTIRLFDAEAFMAEAAAFPNDAHDDQVDAASQALARFFLDGAGAQAWIDAMRAEVAARVAAAPEPVAVATIDPNTPTITDELEHPPVPALDPRQAARQAGFTQHSPT